MCKYICIYMNIYMYIMYIFMCVYASIHVNRYITHIIHARPLPAHAELHVPFLVLSKNEGTSKFSER